MKLKILAAVVAALIVPTAAQAATPVTSLSGDWSASNSTVTLTPDGVHFGTYADGGALGGTLTYSGFNGQPLSALADFSYSFTYRQSDGTTGAAPYARVFLDADADGAADNDVVLDPSFCATTTPAEATDLTYQVVGNSVRFNDDGCDGVPPDNQPYADAIAGHEDETIVGLLVSQGFSTGHDVSALLRQVTVNGTTFVFGAPQAGPPGSTGGTGPAGAPGAVTTATVFVPVPGAVSSPLLRGDDLRVIHAPRHGKERFVKVRATLRGKKLKTRRNSITVDLRGQPAGNYNVHLSTTFRKADGHTHVVRTTRNLSVTPV
jgi:hypothetical protein